MTDRVRAGYAFVHGEAGDSRCDQDGISRGTFFAKEVDGTFRLPILNEGMDVRVGKRNLVILSNMLDSVKLPVKFDLSACKADTTGSLYLYDPNRYSV